MNLAMSRKTLLIASLVIIQTALTGCLMNDPIEATAAIDDGSTNNSAPIISGTPPQIVKVGVNYLFRPTATDPDADALVFTIRNAPRWSTFSKTTGEISGMPFLGDEGTYPDISIEVSDGSMTTAMPSFIITVEPESTTNLPPDISGTPASSVVVGNAYSFTPSATDPDGDTLSYFLNNQPTWLAIDPTTGRLSGTPQAGDVGTYQNISITVSDGQLTSSIPAFSITVDQIAVGQVTLSWTAPTQNTDGTALNDLAGYRIYYGTSPGSYPNPISINSAGITTYVVGNLSPGTYYFVSTAVNSMGIESDYSNVAQKVVTVN